MEFLWSRDEVPPVASNPLTSCPTGERTGRRPPGRRRSPEGSVRMRLCQVLVSYVLGCRARELLGQHWTAAF